jgi:hypothetical protein
MFKLIICTYIAAIAPSYADVNIWKPVQFGATCEIANLQSPFIRKLDNPTVDADKYTPIHACNIDLTKNLAIDKILQQCIRPQKPVKL